MKLIDVGGDLASSAAAFAGLILVFLGAAISGIEGYDAGARSSVVWRYRRRAWPACFALVAALIACFSGLWGKAYDCPEAVFFGGMALVASALGILVASAQMLIEVG